MTDSRIAFVGDFYSDREEKLGVPFAGSRRFILKSICSEVGIDFDSCGQFCAFPINASNDSPYTSEKFYGIKGMEKIGSLGYVSNRFESHLPALSENIARFAPNIIVACGPVALAALTGKSSLKKHRGSLLMGAGAFAPFKILPTFSPEHIFAAYADRLILQFDLDKAKRESDFPELRRVPRRILVSPTLEDFYAFYEEHIIPATDLSVDIETQSNSITEICFAPSPHIVIVVPFFSRREPSGNYWPTAKDELLAWALVRKILATKRTFGQNHAYDMKFLWRTMGIPSPNFCDDTMLMHHTLQPEMEKSLGFLASLYTTEPNWKFMRSEKDDRTE